MKTKSLKKLELSKITVVQLNEKATEMLKGRSQTAQGFTCEKTCQAASCFPYC